MKEQIAVWNIFHDGIIKQIDGLLPNIKVKIEIPYLRNIFSNDGGSIWVRLGGCSFIEYLVWEEEKRLNNLNSIAQIKPEILSVEEVDGKAHLFCVEGELDIKYEDISFELDNGKEVTIPALDKACNTYWDRWKSGHKTHNQ